MAKKGGVSKVSKNQKRRQKAKLLKDAIIENVPIESKEKTVKAEVNDVDDDEIIIEKIQIDNIEQYQHIINNFTAPKEEEIQEQSEEGAEREKEEEPQTVTILDEVITEPTKNAVVIADIPTNKLTMKTKEKPKISKRKYMETHAVPLSDLKSIARPFELNVSWQDVNAPDPYFHIYLKTIHNAIPIPRHWTSKKGFLSSKRGDQKLFELPSFIKATGIEDMRNHGQEDTEETLKARMRARVQPKSGQLDLDYDVLYDAFFKHQIKPELLKYGELYYEGIDGNVDHLTERMMSQFRAGKISVELQKALGMPNASALPPWFENVQRLGPSPDYPNMKITDRGIAFGSEKRKHARWGVLVDDLGSDSENEDEQKEDDQEVDDEGGDYEAQKGDVLLKTYGQSRTTNQQRETVPSNSKPRDLYQILQEKVSGDKTSVYGSGSKAYDIQSETKPRDSSNPQHHERKKESSAKKFRF